MKDCVSLIQWWFQSSEFEDKVYEITLKNNVSSMEDMCLFRQAEQLYAFNKHISAVSPFISANGGGSLPIA